MRNVDLKTGGSGVVWAAGVALLLLVLWSSCGSGGGSRSLSSIIATTSGEQNTSDAPPAPPEDEEVTPPAEQPPAEDSAGDETNSDEPQLPGYLDPEELENAINYTLYEGEEYPPPLEIRDFVYWQVRYNWDKEAAAGDFHLYPELNCGEECVERLELEVTDPWKTFAGRDVVRVAVTAVNVNDLAHINFLLLGEDAKYIPLWAEPGDIFTLEQRALHMNAHDHPIAADGGMWIGICNWEYAEEVEYRPGFCALLNGYEQGWDGSGILAYAYFLKEPWWWEQEVAWTRDTGIEGYRNMAVIPPIALELSDVYIPEMFGGAENQRLARSLEAYYRGGLEDLYLNPYRATAKTASLTEEGDYLWDDLTPEDKAQQYPPAQQTPACALTTQSFAVWPILGDWSADTGSAQYYEVDESWSAQPDPESYYDIELVVDAVDAPEWISSWLVVRYPADYIFDHQEIGTFFGDEEDRIGAALTGIYQHLEAGVARINYDQNGGCDGSGWIETLHFKYNPERGGGGGGGDKFSGGAGGGLGGKSASIYKVYRRFADQFNIYRHEYQFFFGTTKDNYYTEIYRMWYDFREVNGGDYNNDARINIADVTPIARYYNRQLTNPPNYEDPVTYVDGDLSTRVDIGDITPIARNFGFWNCGIYVQLFQMDIYEPGSLKTRSRVPPNVYYTNPNPWVHPMWHVLLGEDASFIGRHYLSMLQNGNWDYAHRYLQNGLQNNKWIVSGDQLGWTFQWVIRNRQ